MEAEGTTGSANLRSHLNEKPILVVQTAFLGDLLLSIPLLRRIKQLKPESKLILVAREGFGRLLKDLEVVDEVFEIRKKDKSSYAVASQALRGQVFEWIIAPHESWTTANFCWSIPAKLKISYDQLWNFLYFKERIKKDRRLPDALRQLSLLSKRDPEMHNWIDNLEVDLRRPDQNGRFPAVPPWASASLREKLIKRISPIEIRGEAVCLFPGSVWPTKQWTEEGFAELGQRFANEGMQVFWLGSKDEMSACKRLESKVKGSRSLAGQLSLLQSLILLAHSKLVISNDSGGQHLAAVAGTPTVTIFGPTVVDQGFRPWNSQSAVAELNDVKCRPCGAHGHKKCPKKTHECMVKLPVALVYQQARLVLKK